MAEPKPNLEGQRTRFEFNKVLWTFGTKIEDQVRPHLNELFKCDLQRSDDIYEKIDFHDPNNKVAVEVKGRRIPSTKYKDTIIPYSKWVESCKLLDDGWKVFYVFVYTDCAKYVELTGHENWKVKLTGSFGIEHHLIPIEEMDDLKSYE